MSHLHHRILGLDPAIVNFGWSCIEVKNTLDAYRVLGCGLLDSPINTMTERLDLDIRMFLSEIRFLLDLYNPSVVVVERFQNRSRIGASQNEKCNIMIGIVLMECLKRNIEVRTPTAAAWKNKVNTKVDLKVMYSQARKLCRAMAKSKGMKPKKITMVVNKTPHSVDSTVLALFEAARHLGMTDKKCLALIDAVVPDKVAKALIQQFKDKRR